MRCLRNVVEKKIRLTFKTILKHLSCKKSWRCGRSGLAGPGGELKCLAVRGRGLAQLQSSEAQAGSPRPTEARLGKDGISVPIWGLSSLCLPFKVPCCLRKHAKYFREGPLCGSNRK